MAITWQKMFQEAKEPAAVDALGLARAQSILETGQTDGLDKITAAEKMLRGLADDSSKASTARWEAGKTANTLEQIGRIENLGSYQDLNNNKDQFDTGAMTDKFGVQIDNKEVQAVKNAQSKVLFDKSLTNLLPEAQARAEAALDPNAGKQYIVDALTAQNAPLDAINKASAEFDINNVLGSKLKEQLNTNTSKWLTSNAGKYSSQKSMETLLQNAPTEGLGKIDLDKAKSVMQQTIPLYRLDESEANIKLLNNILPQANMAFIQNKNAKAGYAVIDNSNLTEENKAKARVYLDQTVARMEKPTEYQLAVARQSELEIEDAALQQQEEYDKGVNVLKQNWTERTGVTDIVSKLATDSAAENKGPVEYLIAEARTGNTFWKSLWSLGDNTKTGSGAIKAMDNQYHQLRQKKELKGNDKAAREIMILSLQQGFGGNRPRFGDVNGYNDGIMTQIINNNANNYINNKELRTTVDSLEKDKEKLQRQQMMYKLGSKAAIQEYTRQRAIEGVPDTEDDTVALQTINEHRTAYENESVNGLNPFFTKLNTALETVKTLPESPAPVEIITNSTETSQTPRGGFNFFENTYGNPDTNVSTSPRRSIFSKVFQDMTGIGKPTSQLFKTNDATIEDIYRVNAEAKLKREKIREERRKNNELSTNRK